MSKDLLLEAVQLLYDWDALVGGSGSVACETRAFLAKVRYDPMTARLADQPSVMPCGHDQRDADSYGGCATCTTLRCLEQAEREMEIVREWYGAEAIDSLLAQRASDPTDAAP